MNHTTHNTANTHHGLTTSRLVLISLVTAITCILAPMSIPIPLSLVPISLTNLILLLGLYVLDWKDALVSYVVYLLIGLTGIPVFSGFSGGPAKLAGPTGGYLVGFIFLILIAGLSMKFFHGRPILIITGIIIGFLVTNLIGTLWLAVQMHISFAAALSFGVLPYLPGDCVKIVIAVMIGPMLQKRIR